MSLPSLDPPLTSDLLLQMMITEGVSLEKAPSALSLPPTSEPQQFVLVAVPHETGTVSLLGEARTSSLSRPLLICPLPSCSDLCSLSLSLSLSPTRPRAVSLFTLLPLVLWRQFVLLPSCVACFSNSFCLGSTDVNTHTALLTVAFIIVQFHFPFLNPPHFTKYIIIGYYNFVGIIISVYTAVARKLCPPPPSRLPGGGVWCS